MPSKVPVGVYQIKITLKGMKPPIWRRVTVPGDITLAGLHEVIQRAMGWMNCHLHEFVVHGERYGSAAAEASDFEEDLVDEGRAHLNKVSGPGEKFQYFYDFGDDWVHEIQIEREIASDGERAAHCLTGKNACPPEDCGGPYGYALMLSILADPEHEEHDEMREWAGDDVDPSAFDLEQINRMLSFLEV